MAVLIAVNLGNLAFDPIIERHIPKVDNRSYVQKLQDAAELCRKSKENASSEEERGLFSQYELFFAHKLERFERHRLVDLDNPFESSNERK